MYMTPASAINTMARSFMKTLSGVEVESIFALIVCIVATSNGA
jgi:hypothetical protein